MAEVEIALPTIDLTLLRHGSEAAKREVARQIDAASTRSASSPWLGMASRRMR